MLATILLAMSAVLKKASAQEEPQPCSELFISELYLEKNPLADDLFELNYALEIFNPTQNVIDLSNYSVELTNGISTTSIPLNGEIAAGETHVIVNSNADLDLQQKADEIASGLDFGNNAALSLMNGNTVIDRIGQNGQPTTGGFDVVQFVTDPYGYLATFHLDLNDYENIDIRRGMFVTAGDPTMNSATELIGNWAYFPNSDRSNIGTHLGMCNKPTAIDIIGYNQPTFDLFISNPSMKDPLTLKVNYVTSGSSYNFQP